MSEHPVTAVIFNTDMARLFLRRRNQRLQKSDDQKGLVQLVGSKPVGAVLYEQFNGTNIWAHCAGSPGKAWLTRQMLHTMFDYPFNQLNCERVSLWIEAQNDPSIQFATRLGFVYDTTLARAGSKGQPVFIYRMFKEDCRYA